MVVQYLACVCIQSGPVLTVFVYRVALHLLEELGFLAAQGESVQRSGLVPSADWLATVLLPKLAQWTAPSLEVAPGPGKGLSLVPLDRYSVLYQELKERHGDHLVKVGVAHATPSMLYVVCCCVALAGRN